MMTHQKHSGIPPKFPIAGGFSLVEVALAIGLLTFALLPIMGLLPMAMNTSRDAIDRSSQVRILQTIRADILASGEGDILQSKIHFFDLQGNSIPGQPQGSDGGGGFYEVTRGIPTTTSLPSGQSSTYLNTVSLTFHRHPQNWISQTTLHVPAQRN